MKRHTINVNLSISKDTPAETLTELYAVLKPLQMQAEKERTAKPLYALNEDIEKLHARYEELFKQVRNSLNLSEKQIELEEETLSRKYKFELEELSKARKLEYDKQQAEIEARAKEQTPWRRGWWWRLIFRPVTNRAQDIIEERAKFEADIGFTAEEKEIEDKRKNFAADEDKPSNGKLKRIMRKELKKIIERADNADVREAFDEPAEPKATAPTLPQKTGNQLPGQVTIDDVQPVQNVPARRPRPPRSCRRA